MYDIQFISEVDDFAPVLIKGVPAGYSILEVALESDIDLHYACGMACSCSSCHIIVQQGGAFLEKAGEREQQFLERAYAPTPASRLGCQSILLDSGGGYLEVLIPDQSKL